MKTGLVLSGGGARGAYQVGVLKAIADLHPKHTSNPFNVITGTSAGAINAVALAASANNFRLGVKKVEKIWNTLHIQRVAKVRGRDLALQAVKLGCSFVHPRCAKDKPLALLDSSPLRDLLSTSIRFENIQQRIKAGQLDAVSVTATSYASGNSVTFFEGLPELTSWRRAKRLGIPAKLSAEHLLASSAIPSIFPAEKIGRQYFGDGSLRQLAPLSSAIRLGAERIVVVGVSGRNTTRLSLRRDHPPSMAQTLGHIFSSAFIDTFENDINNVTQINEMLGILANEAPDFSPEAVKSLDLLVIKPSIDLDDLAAQHLNDLPSAFRRVLRGLGAGRAGGGNLASYVMFEAAFCRELIEQGYRDTMAEEDTVRNFFSL
tara:strand:- start:347 stop:1471 length:1125 start_codon:yes stop_codon:yes gene_type:complete